MTSHRALLLALALTAAPAAVHAQAVPAAPAPAPAAPTREEFQADKGVEQAPQPSRLSIEGGFERGSCALAGPAMAGVKVTFARVTFTDLPGIDPAGLDEAWRGLAGSEQPLAALCEVRDRAAAILRDRGFLAAVQVPPQRIEANGEVRMDVLAAKLVDVQVRGRPGNAERQIAAHLRQLTKRPWFNINEAERQLLLLRDLPGFDVRMTLRPANAGRGEVIGDIVVRRRPVEIVIGGQNLGSRATGREGVVAQVTLNDLTGMGDRTVLSLFSTLQTREQTVWSISHDFAIGADGLRLGGRLIHGRARPDVAGGAFSSKTWIGGLDLSYPFVRSQQATLTGTAGFDVIDQTIDFGTTRLNEDKLRVGYVRLNWGGIDGASLDGTDGWSIAEPRRRAAAEVELRKGFGGFGSSRPCAPLALCLAPNVPISDFAANPQGTLVRGEGELALSPVRGVTAVVRARGQYSAAQLLSFEQFTLGNYTTGRGYDPGAVQGDSGVGLSAELRLGRLMPRSAEGLAFQPYAFADAGWAWTNDGLTPLRRVVSTGGGVRARWGDHGDFNLAVAVPLERLPGQTSLGAARVLLTFSTRFVPWTTQ